MKEKRYGLEFFEALAAVQQGEAREALRHYERDADEFERRGMGLVAAKAHIAVAWIASRLGEFQKAIRAGLRAEQLLKRERQTEEAFGRLTDAYHIVAWSYMEAGDLTEARPHFEAGLESSKRFWGPTSSFYSGLFSRGLATLAYFQEDFPRALQYGKAAVRFLETYRTQLLPEPRFDLHRRNARRLMAMSWMTMGNAHRRLGNFAEAERLLLQAIETSRELHVEEMEALGLGSLGQVTLDRRDPTRALGHFREGLALATRLNLVPSLINLHAGTGWSYFQQRRFGEALAAFRRSVGLLEDVRGQLQEAALRSSFLEDKQGIYHGAVRSALALGKLDEAFSYAERGRARAFLDLLGSQTTLSKGKTRALVEEEVRLRAQLSEARAMAQEMDAGDPARARQQVEATEREYRDFLDRVRRENLEQVSLMTVEPVTLAEVQQLLPEGTTLLEYLVTVPEILLWVIDRQRAEVVRLPGERATLVSQVRALRQAIAERAPIEKVEDLAKTLYERLLAAARPYLRGDRLLIVPHDVLHYLPFSVLRSPEGRWLVEEYTLATLPSASVLKYLQGKGQGAGDRVLALGNPDLGPALALRWAEREARAVGERYPGATVLLRQDATEARTKTLSGEVGLLHFATHGELNEQDPLASALLLVPDGPEDGRLEVREIFALDLQARLVVLSACETGLGKLSRGDELVGLQRAFLYA
ncbi:MAG: CHAT domain-containing protein, partial [Candidatus Rokubacteria bacterium]|nr:CHAT domain-containing protein [Candidatus Rokubacteria bacterium]